MRKLKNWLNFLQDIFLSLINMCLQDKLQTLEGDWTSHCGLWTAEYLVSTADFGLQTVDCELWTGLGCRKRQVAGRSPVAGTD